MIAKFKLSNIGRRDLAVSRNFMCPISEVPCVRRGCVVDKCFEETVNGIRQRAAPDNEADADRRFQELLAADFEAVDH